MTTNLIGKLCAAGAATAALALSPLATAASTVTCVPVSGGGPTCSTDNTKTNTGSITSNPDQHNDSPATGGAGGASSGGGAGGNGGGALTINDQTQTTTNVIAQGIDSGNGNTTNNGDSASHNVVVGGRTFAARGNGGGSFVSLGVGGASNTGGSALTP